MALDLDKIAKEMFEAAFAVLKTKAPNIKSLAETEFRKIAQTILMLEGDLLAGQITQAEATILVDMQKNATRAVLLMVAGMSLLVAEQAINAALGVVRDAVNGVVGVALL